MNYGKGCRSFKNLLNVLLDSAGDDDPERQSVVPLECENNTFDKFPQQSFIVTLIKSIDNDDQRWKGGSRIVRRTNWFNNQFLELICRRFSDNEWIGFNRILN